MWRFLRTSIPILLVISSLMAQVRAGTYCQYSDIGNKICRDSDTIISVKPSRIASKIRLNVNDFSEIAPNAFRSLNLADLQLFHPNPDDCTPKALLLTPLIFNGLSVRHSLTLECVNLTLQPDTFENFKRTHILWLNRVVVGSLRHFLGEFKQLRTLKLVHLNITSIDRDLLSQISDKLETLLIYDDVRVYQEKAFKRFQNLKHLAIRETHFSLIVSDFFEGLEQLQYLDLGKNKITNLYDHTFRNLKNLEELCLADNRISEIQSQTFSGSRVSKIDLRNNHLTNQCLDIFPSMKNLKSLDLSYNNINTLQSHAFEGMINLERLNLEHNGIHTIKPTAFWDLRLDNLNLRGNNLTVLERGIFIGLHFVNLLDLRSNDIREIKPEAFINLEAGTVLLCYPDASSEYVKAWGVEDAATVFNINSC